MKRAFLEMSPTPHFRRTRNPLKFLDFQSVPEIFIKPKDLTLY